MAAASGARASEAAGTTRFFWGFCAVHVVLWTLLPVLLKTNAPLDVLEGLAWGREWQWGYSKHPPLAPWLTEAASRLGGGALWPVFLLSQLCVAVTFWAVWRLAREFVDERRALVAVLALEGIGYYNVTSFEFNPNVLQLPLWALAILAGWRALQTGRLVAWAACGFCFGLGLLAKYYTGILIAPLALLLLFTPEGRRRLRTPGPYLAAAVAAGVVLPHLLWMARHDWVTVAYMLRRAGGPPETWGRLLYPLRFTGAQLAVLVPAAAVLAALAGWAVLRPRAQRPERFADVFLLAAGLGPFLLTVLLSALVGWRLKSMWGTPLWSLAGLLLVRWLPEGQVAWQPRRTAAVAGATMVAAALFYTVSLRPLPGLVDQDRRAVFPGEAVAKRLTTAWRARTGLRIPYVVGDVWLAGNVGYYSPDRPSLFIDARQQDSAWIREERVREQGALIVWSDAGTGLIRRRVFLKRFPEAEVQAPLPVGPRGGTETPAVGWAILWPRGLRAARPAVHALDSNQPTAYNDPWYGDGPAALRERGAQPRRGSSVGRATD